MKAAIFYYGDLLELEYEDDQLDTRTGRTSCAGVCREVLRRLGIDPETLLANVPDLAMELARPAVADRWDFLGTDLVLARQLGDTIPSLGRGGCAHVATVVQETPPRVISAAIGKGVYTMRPALIRRSFGVWRPVR